MEASEIPLASRPRAEKSSMVCPAMGSHVENHDTHVSPSRWEQEEEKNWGTVHGNVVHDVSSSVECIDLIPQWIEWIESDY